MTSLILAAALKGTVLLMLAWAATALLRNFSADLRHRVWLAALCGLAALLIPVPVPDAVRMDLVYTIAAGAAPSSATPNAWPLIWGLGFLVVLSHFAAGVARLYSLTRRAEATALYGVWISHGISSPLTWGNTILLPSYARDWSIAIAHERAHMQRRDWWWQSLARIIAAIFWFHPLVWFAAARLRHEAELAVDDAVLASGTEPARYAEQLLDVARRLRHAPQIGAVAMVRRPELSHRIAAILDVTRARTLAGVRSRVSIALVAFCAVPILSAFQSHTIFPPPTPLAPPVMQPVMVAQAEPKPSAPAPPPAPAPREPQRIGNGVSAPIPVDKPEPVYPDEARESRIEGEVWLGVVIDENGIPTEVSVTKGLEPSLDGAAVSAVEKWRFKPGMKDGQPVSVRATIAVNFKLL
jgi:TonB family protein